MVNLNEDQYIFLITAGSVILKMRNVSDESFRENHNTYFIMDNFFSKIVPFIRKCIKIM